MYNGSMYVFGGYDGSKRLNDLFKLDISAFPSLFACLAGWPACSLGPDAFPSCTF
jgi:hypothetical protein